MKAWFIVGSLVLLCVSSTLQWRAVLVRLDALSLAIEAPLVYYTPEGKKIVLTPQPDGSMIMKEHTP